jgi:pimeloyl-ACP methyl ester carboxylesterase
MGRGSKILIGVLAALAVLVVINVLVTDGETKSAEVTMPDGRLLSLPAGEVQVVEAGPRSGSPIVLVHCFTCSVNWWQGMIPLLARDHRVVAMDLRGHGGSEKPADGYSMPEQADLVAATLGRLGVRNATVVGHSLGGPVSIALAEQSPELVNRLVIMDSGPDVDSGDLGLIGELPFKPVIGQTLWRIKPDFSIEDGLEVAFAPGFPVPDQFVEDVKRMTYGAYDGSHEGFDEYASEKPLPDRLADVGKPTLAIMGAEEQLISDPEAALAAYRAGGARTRLIAGAGHSPNVEKPAQIAALVLAFQPDKRPAKRVKARKQMQAAVQKPDAVRTRP